MMRFIKGGMCGNSLSGDGGALGRKLGVSSYYEGNPLNKPYIGDPHGEIKIEDITKSHRVMFAAPFLSLVFFVWVFWELGIR